MIADRLTVQNRDNADIVQVPQLFDFKADFFEKRPVIRHMLGCGFEELLEPQQTVAIQFLAIPGKGGPEKIIEAPDPRFFDCIQKTKYQLIRQHFSPHALD